VALQLPYIDWGSIWHRYKRQRWWVESGISQIKRERAIQLGYTGAVAARRPFMLYEKQLFTHKHIIGKTGYGKSNLLAHISKQLIEMGIGVALIDPHADLANDLLWSLYDSGYFQRPEVKDDPTKKLLYIDFDIVNDTDQTQYFLPFNVLKQPYDKYKIARNFVETCRRVWPYLRDGAPQFENILLNAIIVLIDNDLPLTRLQKLINEPEYRNYLLEQVDDPDVVGFFRHRFDKWSARDMAQMVESTLNKILLLTFSPVLRYSLGQPKNALDFQEIINSGTSVIFNLGGLDEETRRFVACFLTMGFEQAIYARKRIPKYDRRDYFLVVDEFQDSVSTSQTTFNMFLSEARKYRGWFIGANQYLGQIPFELLQGLQNTMRISLRLEDDAIQMAQRIGKYDPEATHREVSDEEAKKRVLPRDYMVQEQYELLANEINELDVGEGFIKLEHRKEKFKAMRFGEPTKTTNKQFQEVREWYARRLMTPREKAIAMVRDDSSFPAPDAANGHRGTIRRRRRGRVI
jgi:hypothetical protein